MNSEPALKMLPAWLHPVMTVSTNESIASHKAWVLALVEARVDTKSLALATFRHAPPHLVLSLEREISERVPTYAPESKAELVAHLAAVALLHLVETDEDIGVVITSECASLLYLGWTPATPEFQHRLDDFRDRYSRRARRRVPLDATFRPARKRTNNVPTTRDVDIAQLEANFSKQQDLLNRAVERIEVIVEQFNNQLALLDEEVDVLWWSRSQRSSVTGQAWSDVKPLDRAIRAGIEVAAIVDAHPPTRGTISVLNEVVGSDSQTYGYMEIVAELHSLGWNGPTANSAASPFQPLSSGVALWRKFDGNRAVLSTILATEFEIVEDQRFSAAAVAHQILNERALQSDNE